MKTDVCYGPITAGQFFVERMNAPTLAFYKVTGTYPGVDDLFFCDSYGMQLAGGEWTFGVDPLSRGVQIHLSNLERMDRVSEMAARHEAEQGLRHRDDKWHKEFDPNYRTPAVKIVRCTCGIGDDAGRTRHASGCFLRGEV